jgi:alkaline phosphatase D
MNKRIYVILILFVFSCLNSFAQKELISGPWAGNIELRTAAVWMEVGPSVQKISLQYFPEAHPEQKKLMEQIVESKESFHPIKFLLNGLEPNTSYQYTIQLNKRPVTLPFSTKFTTKPLWQYRTPAPNFSFLAGSCAYFNEPIYDRPGKPYGNDSSIFQSMAKEDAAFHLWLGDAWYNREVDFGSPWGLQYRASRDRSFPILQPFLASMPQYFIWDDHDYGPNDAGLSYIFKKESRNIFQQYTLNPSYGMNGEGIFTQYSYGDVDFFMTDNRSFRADEKMLDSIDGKPNPNKTYWGETQMQWLKNALLQSRASFKIIVSGSQVLNTLNNYECMQHYSYEFQECMKFLETQKIPGVLFLTGDRHHSEIIQYPRSGHYTLFDITASPYTSGVSMANGIEKEHPLRVTGTLIEKHNYARIEITGPKNNRTLTVQFKDKNGDLLGTWNINEKSLQY